jgi:hypothetical protein
VIERGQHTRLALESGDAFGIARKGLGQDLQGDGTMERRVSRLPDDAHAAFAEFRLDAVAGERGSGLDQEITWEKFIGPRRV